MKPMLPTLTSRPPLGNQWIFEPKYDGFRALFHLEKTSYKFISRNGHDITSSFPEIEQFVQENLSSFTPFLPLLLDGELVCLNSRYKSDFEAIQQRGRLKSKEKIRAHTDDFPCHYVVFDILSIKGVDISKTPLIERKEKLQQLFDVLHFPLHVCPKKEGLIQLTEMSRDFQTLWKKVVADEGEGVVAKQLNSTWEKGKRTKQWLKIKNYRTALFFITGYDESNGYFHIGVHHQGNILSVGSFTHGMNDEERNALLHIIKENGTKNGHFIELIPSICIKLNFLSFSQGQLREPSFHSFALESLWEECTLFQLKIAGNHIHRDVHFTHLDKVLWPKTHLKKDDYLGYMADVSPFMLPFLQNRALTVVRYPHGLSGEAFFQKNCPDYAPSFVKTVKIDRIEYIVCEDLSTLMWLSNQLAIEYHIPFHTIHNQKPKEIVFDLDPPSRNHFHLAIRATRELKECFERFNLVAYPKLSGNKGIQLHIPLPSESLTYDETRAFTAFFAQYLVEQFPHLFTSERLKKNRGERLYVDYIQHARGKTIICPYSVRGNENGTVAAPLFWDEVHDQLDASTYTMEFVLKRLKARGCPLKSYFTNGQDEVVRAIIDQLRHL
ncbi:DNA ligase D [Bacillus sp. FJAT-47783]|uniref:DNA ligase D n=1 Tax=Bacillus sp. FJAT-47783 TaxID=2922712 RepID=UPI001FAD404E|nr:DNA ligase D [Bacillus sp. FJAT-47783]